jgi:hypothetical protein
MGPPGRDGEDCRDPEECREYTLNLGNTANPLIVNKDRVKKVFRFMLWDLEINFLIWL